MAFSEMHSRTLTVFLFSTILGAMPSGLTAAPKISDAYLDDSGDVIITGSKFGNGPTVAIHDDFSNAEVGDDTVSLSPKVGKWLISNSNSNLVNSFLGAGVTGLLVLIILLSLWDSK